MILKHSMYTYICPVVTSSILWYSLEWLSKRAIFTARDQDLLRRTIAEFCDATELASWQYILLQKEEY